MRRLIAVLIVLMMTQACSAVTLAEESEIENYTRYTDYTPQQAEPMGLIPGTDHGTLVAWFSRVGNTVFDPDVDVVSTASLDIVINNAAIGEQKMIDETDDEWLEHVYQTNVFGPFRFIREALKIFMPKNEGCIINISSVNGDRPFCGAAYTSSKGAINTLTKNVAMRLIDTNIRINAVAPGATVTPAHLANKAGEQPGGAKMLEYSRHFVYFPGPECDPIDQANACLFLASDMGRHVKGQVIQVCNGAFL